MTSVDASRTDSERTVRMTVNGVPREATVPVRRVLADALRDDLGLTGTHVGCAHGVCGSCTVLVDGDLQISAATRLHLARTLFRRAVAALAPEAGLGPIQEIAA